MCPMCDLPRCRTCEDAGHCCASPQAEDGRLRWAARRQRLSPDKAEAGRKGNIRVCLAAAMVTDQDDQDFPKAPPLTSATELYERGVITSAQRAVLEEEAGLKGTGKIFVAAAMATRNTVPEL